jgi:hypothetical protein
VSDGKKALIITDGTQSIQSIAQSISQTLSGYNINLCPAEKFAGNDLLPADIFFIGCENPKPSSFAYLEELLLHINLSSRKCGIFSVNKKTLDYLGGILKDSEADLFEPLLSGSAVSDVEIKDWINKSL